jgi:hypothetical protein
MVMAGTRQCWPPEISARARSSTHLVEEWWKIGMLRSAAASSSAAAT